MAPLDCIAIALLLLSMVLGMVRGLVFEVISLVGWIAAFVIAQVFAEDVGRWLPLGQVAAGWRYAAGFVLVFVGVAFGIGLVANLTRKLVTAIGLRPVDRVLGGVFGVVRAALALLVLAVVVHLLALSDSEWWRGTRSAQVLDTALQGLKPALPVKLAGYLP